MEPGFTMLVEGCIKGYHVYEERPRIMEKLSCEREMSNKHHIWAVKVVKPKSGDPVGHVPREFGRPFCNILAQDTDISW